VTQHPGPVVVGYDAKDPAKRALARAIEEAKTRGVGLVVVSVEDLPLDPEGPQNYGGLEDAPVQLASIVAPEEIQQQFEEAGAVVGAAGVEAEYLWGAGDPARFIADAAKDRKASVVVLGAHHHRFLDSILGTDVPAEVEHELGTDVIVVE
jgi:nucleotide-binding universal stress UspA family protein